MLFKRMTSVFQRCKNYPKWSSSRRTRVDAGAAARDDPQGAAGRMSGRADLRAFARPRNIRVRAPRRRREPPRRPSSCKRSSSWAPAGTGGDVGAREQGVGRVEGDVPGRRVPGLRARERVPEAAPKSSVSVIPFGRRRLHGIIHVMAAAALRVLRGRPPGRTRILSQVRALAGSGETRRGARDESAAPRRRRDGVAGGRRHRGALC